MVILIFVREIHGVPLEIKEDRRLDCMLKDCETSFSFFRIIISYEKLPSFRHLATKMKKPDEPPRSPGGFRKGYR